MEDKRLAHTALYKAKEKGDRDTQKIINLKGQLQERDFYSDTRLKNIIRERDIAVEKHQNLEVVGLGLELGHIG